MSIEPQKETWSIFDKRDFTTQATITSSLTVEGSDTVADGQGSVSDYGDGPEDSRRVSLEAIGRKDSACDPFQKLEQESVSAQGTAAASGAHSRAEEQPDEPSMSAWSNWDSSDDESDSHKKKTSWGVPFLRRTGSKPHEQAGKEEKDVPPEGPSKYKVPKADRTKRKISFSLGMLRRGNIFGPNAQNE